MVNHITAEESKKMEKRLKYPYNAIWIIGTANGLRISDVLNLTLKNIGNGRPTVTIRKTNKSKRIYIPKRAQRLVYANESLRDTNSPTWNISRQAVHKAFNKAAHELGITANVGTHTMRKTYAYKLLNNGKTYKYIQNKLQHDNLGDTLRYLI